MRKLITQSGTASHRLWLYGANFFLLCIVLLFSVAVRLTILGKRMILVPIQNSESLIIMAYIGSAIQAADVFLCFFGVWRRKIWLVFIYWQLLVLLIIFDFVFTILWVIRFQNVHKTLPAFLYGQVTKRFFDDRLACPIWDNIQLEFNCCGVYSYRDWVKVPNWCEQDLGNDTDLPRSCCENEYIQCNSTILYNGHLEEEEDGPDGQPIDLTALADQTAARLMPHLLKRPGCKKNLLLWLHNSGTNWFVLTYCSIILIKIILCIILKSEIREFSGEVDMHDNHHKNGNALNRAFSVQASPFVSLLEEERREMSVS